MDGAAQLQHTAPHRMAARLITEPALRIQPMVQGLSSARMVAVVVGRPVREVCSVIAAQRMAGVEARQIIVVLDVRALLGAADGWNVADLAVT